MLMSEVVEKPVTEDSNPAPSDAPSVEVYAVYGVEPEIQAYAMAKYSRSALSMKESLRGDQPAEGGEVSQHLLLPVRPPLHRRFGAHRAGHRTSVDSGRHRGRRRAALGRSGAFHPLSGLQEERLLRPRVRREPCGSGRLARPNVCEGFLPSDGRFPVFRIRDIVRPHVSVPGQHYPETRGDEAGGLRANPARPRLRYFPLPAAAGHQHFTGRDRQRPHAREPGVASALAYSQGNPAIGRAAETRRDVGPRTT